MATDSRASSGKTYGHGTPRLGHRGRQVGSSAIHCIAVAVATGAPARCADTWGVTKADRDRWSEWLLERRHGGDSERRKEVASHLAGIRDTVLDRADPGPGDTVLDVGCGDGLIGFGALERVGPTGRVIFSDISDDLLNLCRKHAIEAGKNSRCEMVRASADDLAAIGDATVDAVTTRAVLIYIGDKAACFNEFFRVLRSGGRLSVYEPINAHMTWRSDSRTYCGYDVAPVAGLAAKLEALYARYQAPDADPMLDFDERDLLEAAEQAGFAEIHLQLRLDIEPWLPPLNWDSFLNSAGNPLIPTHAEAIAATLTADQADRFQAHLRPLVEAGAGTHRLAITHLWAVKH
jgi:arsenite methyltransferase